MKWPVAREALRCRRWAAIGLAGSLALAVVAPCVRAATKSDSTAAAWEKAMVKIEITRKQHDYSQPWNSRPENYAKNGIVVEGHQVLTTADFLSDATLVRVQKGGRGEWVEGKIEWADFHANLALVSVAQAAFWEGLPAAAFVDRVATRGDVDIVRWRDGQFEVRKADISRVQVQRSKLSFVEQLQMELNSEIKGAGWSEAVVSGRRLIGLATQQEGGTVTVTPAPFIKSVLEARRRGAYRGLGYFDFVWQRTENPATHRYLGLEGEPRGVVVIEVPYIPGRQSPLRVQDLILRIDGFDIDFRGDYLDPVYGSQMLEGLSTRGRWAGDTIKIQVWREGRMLDLDYTIPRADFDTALVPQGSYERAPEYLVSGGLVFQPLTEAYLRSWGGDWRRRVPFRLGYYLREDASPQRPSIVVLSTVLPDSANLGYADYRYLAVQAVNGVKIGRIADLAAAFEKPQNGFHVIDFARGDSFSRLVMDADQTAAATSRVLLRYGIDEPARIHSSAAPATRN